MATQRGKYRGRTVLGTVLGPAQVKQLETLPGWAWEWPVQPTSPFRVLACLVRTLNAAGQSRVFLLLRQERLSAALGHDRRKGA